MGRRVCPSGENAFGKISAKTGDSGREIGNSGFGDGFDNFLKMDVITHKKEIST